MKKMLYAFLFLIVIIALLIVNQDPRFSKFLGLKTLMTGQKMSASPTSTPDINHTTSFISINQQGFFPQVLTIKTGTKVIWRNATNDITNISSYPSASYTTYTPLNLGLFATGATKSLTFDTPGTYMYDNHLNPSQKGTIIVK